MLYPKINSLYKRVFLEESEFKKQDRDARELIIGEYAREEFGCINKWLVEEKIDGTNIRIIYDGNDVKFMGRQSDSNMPLKLLKYLMATFTRTLFQEKMPWAERVILFGEGYGKKIQNGGNYRDDQAFMLFDAFINHRWSTQTELDDIALLLNIPRPPKLGIMTEQEIVTYIKSKPFGQASLTGKQYVTEGVMCRPAAQMLFAFDHNPIQFKLKCVDFK